MKKSLYFIIGFLFIFIFRLNYLTFKNDISVGDIVNIVGRVEAGRGAIETIDGKYPIKNIYFNVNKVSDGYKELIGEVETIKYYKDTPSYKINVFEEKNKNNILKNFFTLKIKSMTENYSLDLEIFLRAVLLGEKNLIFDDWNDLFRYTGTAHLLVISGLHIGIIIAGLNFLFLKINIKKQLRFSLVFIILTIYTFAIGLSPSVFRAYIMGSIYIFGNILYEKSDSKKCLALAFVISLLIYPTWIYSISFWMSYTAVFSIIFIYNLIPKLRFKNRYITKIADLFLLTLTIQIFMTPIFFIFFKKIPFLSVFSNLIIIPIASLLIILSFIALLLSNIYLSFLIMPIVNFLYILLIKLLEFFYKIPYLTIDLLK